MYVRTEATLQHLVSVIAELWKGEAGKERKGTVNGIMVVLRRQ